MITLSIFQTDLGWFGLFGSEGDVVGLSVGHGSAAEVRRSPLRQQIDDPDGCFEEADWQPGLRHELQAYARGDKASFSGYTIRLPVLTPFQQRVVAAARNIPFGQTRTYGELAALAGSPRAARAVGNVMKANRVPILVPCHRVVASGGRLGGYSAPQGISLKRRLLELEAAGA